MKKESLPVGRPSVLRRTNALSILGLLRESETLSRADLVRATGLSAPTVTNVVNDLISSGLVEPLGGGESSGGRPPDMIRFRTEHGCILAVDITATGVSLLLTDLNGSKPETLRFAFGNRKTTPSAVCRYIAESLRTLLQKQKKAKEQLKAVVVGVPAITNVEDGVVLSISTLSEWRSVPLRRMFNEFVDCLVIIENDTNLAALGEQHRGVAQSERDFVYISLDANIGAGIILDGKIHHGSQWSAGEIAYLRLPSLSRKHPTLHEFGEMETILTSSGILRSWQEMSKKTRNGAKGAAEETRCGEDSQPGAGGGSLRRGNRAATCQYGIRHCGQSLSNPQSQPGRPGWTRRQPPDTHPFDSKATSGE